MVIPIQQCNECGSFVHFEKVGETYHMICRNCREKKEEDEIQD